MLRAGSFFVVDDMIVGGGTMLRAAKACREHGARAVHTLAAHGLFSPAAGELFSGDVIDTVTVTDSAAPFDNQWPGMDDRLTVLSVAGLFAETIRRLHEGGSISDLLEFSRAAGG